MPMTPLQEKFHRLIKATKLFDERFYLQSNADVRTAGIDPLEHYITLGEREGRAPFAFFDPNWYRLQLPKLTRETCLLAHYLTVGDGDRVQPMVGFDPAYVRDQLGTRREPALIGFVRQRARGKWINPNRFFDYDWYLRDNPDVAAAGVDAYYHFIHGGADEGRSPSEEVSWFYLRERYHLSGTNIEAWRALMLRWRHIDNEGSDHDAPSVLLLQEQVRENHKPSEHYEAHAAPPPAGSRRKCDVYAFYLTQYHRVAENDAWWGEGFTEWHNVVRGVPRFDGHYQPRVPSALGFYDLEDPRVMPRQVELAKQAGLAGLAFYYYHFGGQRLLERPLERFLADKSLDCGFFLIWANETWSRRWDGSENEILLEQTYPPDMPEKLAEDLGRYFADPRYRRIDGRPLLPVYRAASIPDAREWIEALRAAFRARGEDPLLYLAQTFEDLDPAEYGLDGAMEFPPHKYSRYLKLAMPTRIFGANPAMKVWDYDDFADVALADPDPDYPLIRGCFPSWDNDSRRQGASSIIHGSTPQKFQRWLHGLVEKAEAATGRPPIVCINAWNEWGEGAYLEPDRHFGYAYLNAVQAVLHPPAHETYRRVALVGHDAFAAGSQRLLLNLGRTLKQDFGVEIVFVLLRADDGYDGLLAAYREVGETIVVEGDGDVAKALVARDFRHAIVNSSASSPALAPFADAGIALIQLIHELPSVFEALAAAAPMHAARAQVRRFVAPTRAIAAMVERAGIDPARVAILPQGQYHRLTPIDRTEARADFLGEEDDRGIVAGLGYGDRRKGVDLFVETCEAAMRAELPLRFVWQGDWDADTEAELADRVGGLTAAGYLLHLPDAPDIERLLCAADVFLLSSREDPLPSAAIEAWSVGVPVAAVRGAGGIADLIGEEAALGALAETASADALLPAVEHALAMGLSPARAGWAAEQFNWPRYVRCLLRELYAAPDVHVAIVGHNHGSFAEQRIASIVRQTLPPGTIDYHDVASTDGSPAAVEKVAERLGVRLVRSPANDGKLFATWSAITAAAASPYIHIAEGDDWIAPAMLEKCVAALDQAPGAAYAFTAVEWIDAGDRVIADHRDYPASVIGAEIAGGGEIGAATLLGSQLLVKNPILTVSSVVWRREALLSLIEGNRLSLSYLSFAFDWLLYLRAARAGHSAAFVPETLCRHRQHASSFAARDDLARHAAEIRKIYELEPDAAAQEARAAYLASLG
jgi:glycosyltransferase involved in cell wall biosynthesis